MPSPGLFLGVLAIAHEMAGIFVPHLVAPVHAMLADGLVASVGEDPARIMAVVYHGWGAMCLLLGLAVSAYETDTGKATPGSIGLGFAGTNLLSAVVFPEGVGFYPGIALGLWMWSRGGNKLVNTA